jgi:hypothetical protein
MKRSLAALLILMGSAAMQGCLGTTESVSVSPTTPAGAPAEGAGNPDTKSGPAGIDPSQK